MPVVGLLRKHGISRPTFFKWRSRYGEATVSDVRRLRELKAENAKLKRMYAVLAMENAAIKEVLSIESCRPSAKRQLAAVLVTEHHVSVQRACRVVRLSRAAYYWPRVVAAVRDAVVIDALTTLVAEARGMGVLEALWPTACARAIAGTTSVCTALRLNLPHRMVRRVPKRVRQPLEAPPRLNQTWAMDFISDMLDDGRRVRCSSCQCRLQFDSPAETPAPGRVTRGRVFTQALGFVGQSVWTCSAIPCRRDSPTFGG